MAIDNFHEQKHLCFLSQKTKITEEIPSLTQHLDPWEHKTRPVHPQEGLPGFAWRRGNLAKPPVVELRLPWSTFALIEPVFPHYPELARRVGSRARPSEWSDVMLGVGRGILRVWE